METLVLLTAGLKPIIDCSWQLKAGPLNLQSLVGLAVLAAAAVEALRTRTRYWWPFLAVLAVVPVLAALNGGSLLFTTKYLASYAGLFLIPVVAQRAKAQPLLWLRGAVLASLAFIAAALLAQLWGLLPWHSYDQFGNEYYGIPGLTPSNNIVGRLTGFYYHPLDLMRFLAWVFLALLYGWYAAWQGSDRRRLWGYALLLVVMQYVFLRTTHRTTMFYSVFAMALLAFQVFTGWRRRLAAFAAVLTISAATWGLGVVMTKTNTPVGMEDLFNVNHIVDTRAVTAPEAFPNAQGVKLNMGRGRFRIWVGHVQWMASSFSAKDWLMGTGRVPQDVVDEEPHQQLLDFLQRYGILGTLILLYAFGACLMAISAPRHLKVAAVATLVWYGLITECLVMPTFPWCAALFLMLPLWAPQMIRASEPC